MGMFGRFIRISRAVSGRCDSVGKHLEDRGGFRHAIVSGTRLNKAALPAMPAVSIRSVLTPRLIAIHPDWTARSCSAFEKPPSGPTARTRDRPIGIEGHR